MGGSIRIFHFSPLFRTRCIRSHYREDIAQVVCFSGRVDIVFAGINGGVPQALYLLGVPFITLFRQWYHFHPYILLCISYMAVQCLCLLNSERVVGVQGSDRVPVLQTDLRNGAALVLLFIVPMYGAFFFRAMSRTRLSKARRS